LADTTAAQSFSIEAVRSNDKDQDLMLTLEIASIYKGDKYADTAITEIYFNGIDVH
jgi:hypothetical protein